MQAFHNFLGAIAVVDVKVNYGNFPNNLLYSSKKIIILMNNLSISSMALTQAFINAIVNEAEAISQCVCLT